MSFTFTEADAEFVVRHVEPYLPDKIFDAHAHLFCHEHYTTETMPPSLVNTPSVIGLDVYRDYVKGYKRNPMFSQTVEFFWNITK